MGRDATRDDPSPRSQRAEAGVVAFALGGCLAVAVAIGIGRFVYTPILPAMAEALRLSHAQTGLIGSANLFGYLLGALLTATPLLAGSRRPWLLGALVAAAATTGLMGVSSAMPAFLALRLAGGVASAIIFVCATSMVLDRLKATGRAPLSALHYAGIGTGIVGAALIVALATHLGGDWRTLWLASAAISFVMTGAVAVLMKGGEGSTAAAAGPPAPRRDGTRRDLALLATAYGLFGFGYVVTATFLVAILRASPGLRPIEALVWVVFGLAAIPSVAFWNAVVRRLGIRRTFAAACLVEAAGVLASVATVGAAGALVGAVFLGGTFVGITALGLGWGRALAGGDPRRAFALLMASFGLGQVLGPSFAGALADRTGSFLLPSVIAAVALAIGAVLSLRVRRGGP